MHNLPEKEFFQYTPGSHRLDLFFPNNRAAAFGSLGYQTVYHLFQSQPEFFVSRFYYDPISDKPGVGSKPEGEILALSIAYELDILNLLKAFQSWGIEPLAEKRRGPLVIAGGVLTLMNPFPLAPFVDLFLLGDGELLIPEFHRNYMRNYLLGKDTILKSFRDKPGFWAPAISLPSMIKPVLARRASPLHSSFVSEDSHFGDMFLIEVGRGCPRKCRFCASSHVHHYEYHSLDAILRTIDSYLSGQPSTIGLIGSALSDYPELDHLLAELIARGHRPGVSSLRPDAITPEIARLLAKSGVKTITIAPEAGSLKMRKLIGKGVSDGKIMESVKAVKNAGIENIKLYFLIGLPGEQDEDIEAMLDLIRRIIEVGTGIKFEVSVNAFVPKPHTPFQWAGMAQEHRLRKIRRQLRKSLPNVTFNHKSPAQEVTQALISAGNREVGYALMNSLYQGTSFKQALRDLGTDPAKILLAKPDDYIFPWDVIGSTHSKAELLTTWQSLKKKLIV